jgi:hypothetical protein
MEAKRIETGKITIREFRLVKGQIDSPFDFKVSDIKSFDFKVDFNTGFNLEENLIKADFVIDVTTKSNHVEDLKEHTAMAEDKGVDWNPFLANAIASITYSTSRGILMSRFQGTIMKDFILPVVDPNSLWAKKPEGLPSV